MSAAGNSGEALHELADRAVAAAARFHERQAPTSLAYSGALSRRFGCDILLKTEHLLPTGSFKYRGAYNRLALLDASERARGVVAASTGNHGAAVALAGREAGVAVTVHAPRGASVAKLAAIEALGARLVLHDGDSLAAETAARAAAARAGASYVSPYNDLDVIAGQGGIAVELLEQDPAIDAVVASVGGGGLLCGVGAVLRRHAPSVELIAAWPAHATSLRHAMRAGAAVPVEESPTLSDATAGAVEPGAVTIALAAAVAPTCVEVAEPRIAAAMRAIAEDEHWIVEGAAALALAAIEPLAARLAGKRVAVILCGRNIDFDRFRDATGRMDEGRE